MKHLTIILFIFIYSYSHAQTKNTICIDNVQYVVTIDNNTHKVRSCKIVEEVTFMEKLYFGFSTPLNYGNYKQEIIYDLSEWGKISMGYDFGHKALTIGAYVSLGRLYKRQDCKDINVIYF